jgi:hypothetical protein
MFEPAVKCHSQSWTVTGDPKDTMMETMVSTEARPVTATSATMTMPRAPTVGVGKPPMDEIARRSLLMIPRQELGNPDQAKGPLKAKLKRHRQAS